MYNSDIKGILYETFYLRHRQSMWRETQFGLIKTRVIYGKKCYFYTEFYHLCDHTESNSPYSVNLHVVANTMRFHGFICICLTSSTDWFLCFQFCSNDFVWISWQRLLLIGWNAKYCSGKASWKSNVTSLRGLLRMVGSHTNVILSHVYVS